MIDIVERLRDNYTWLTRDGFDTSARNIADAANEIESLRQQLAKSEAEIESWTLLQTTMEKQLAEKDAEIERLKTVPMKYRRMEFNAQLQRENVDLRLQLAEVDALRSHQESVEATHRITLRDVQKEAMRLQSENDALRQQLAEKSAESDRRLDLMNTLDAENESLRKQLKLCAAGNSALREAGFENGFEGIPLVEVVRDGVLDIY